MKFINILHLKWKHKRLTKPFAWQPSPHSTVGIITVFFDSFRILDSFINKNYNRIAFIFETLILIFVEQMSHSSNKLSNFVCAGARFHLESTVIFGQLFVISRLVWDSMQRIWTCRALEWPPRKMHTKTMHMVFPEIETQQKIAWEWVNWRITQIIAYPPHENLRVFNVSLII